MDMLMSTSVVFPVKKAPEEDFTVSVPPLERASAIAKAHEELLGLLRDAPESDYELSLTDLVEKKPAATTTYDLASSETISTIGDQGLPTSACKQRKKKMMMMDSRSRSSSSSDGVLLNMYMPTSLSRTLTASRSSKRNTDHRLGVDLINKRDGEPTRISCWTAIWDCRRRKSKRPQLERTK